MAKKPDAVHIFPNNATSEKELEDNAVPVCEEHHNHHIHMADLPGEDNLYRLADLFKVFGDPTRIRILYALACQELCVCDIAKTLQMTQSAISHQLRVLKQMHLVKYRREGKTIYYSLADSHVQIMLAQGLEHVME